MPQSTAFLCKQPITRYGIGKSNVVGQAGARSSYIHKIYSVQKRTHIYKMTAPGIVVVEVNKYERRETWSIQGGGERGPNINEVCTKSMYGFGRRSYKR